MNELRIGDGRPGPQRRARPSAVAPSVRGRCPETAGAASGEHCYRAASSVSVRRLQLGQHSATAAFDQIDDKGPGVEIDVAILPHRVTSDRRSLRQWRPRRRATRGVARCRLDGRDGISPFGPASNRAPRPTNQRTASGAPSTNRATASVSLAPLPPPRVRGMQGRESSAPTAARPPCARVALARRLWSARQYAARAAGRA